MAAVDVLIPTYRRPLAMAVTLAGVHAQSFRDFTVTISDQTDEQETYLDRPEILEYPTETWAAQELRKGNVLRLAARHADEPLKSRLWQRGVEFADRAWNDLFRFESRRTSKTGRMEASWSTRARPGSRRCACRT